ncbi:hypothetical protein HYW53_00975 [Candidatus Giovannonibacteria bacterium]|nr:hypothetical protein [Candidatus Giovannonibacteria bacterium]
MFTQIRKSAIAVLIGAVALFAFLGILSIWEVIAKEDVYKSLTSMGIISFASFLIVLISLEREGKLLEYFSVKGSNQVSGVKIFGAIAIVIIVIWILSSAL